MSPRPTPGRPFAKRYAELLGGDCYHPADAVVDAVPEIAARARRLRRLSGEIAKHVPNRAAFIRYEDLRTEQQIDREELFFDAGHAHGEVQGRQESLDASASATPQGRELARTIRKAALTSELPRDIVVAVVLESARALVLGATMRRPRAPQPTR